MRLKAAQSSQPTPRHVGHPHLASTAGRRTWRPTTSSRTPFSARVSRSLQGPCSTNVPGIEVGELFPRTGQGAWTSSPSSARCTTRPAITLPAAHWMLTGYFGATAGRLEATDPSGGSIAAKVCGSRKPGVPPLCRRAACRVGRVGARLQRRWCVPRKAEYNPFQSGGDPNAPNYTVQNMKLPNGMSLSDLDDRKRLLGGFDTLRAATSIRAEPRRPTSTSSSSRLTR